MNPLPEKSETNGRPKEQVRLYARSGWGAPQETRPGPPEDVWAGSVGGGGGLPRRRGPRGIPGNLRGTHVRGRMLPHERNACVQTFPAGGVARRRGPGVAIFCADDHELTSRNAWYMRFARRSTGPATPRSFGSWSRRMGGASGSPRASAGSLTPCSDKPPNANGERTSRKGAGQPRSAASLASPGRRDLLARSAGRPERGLGPAQSSRGAEVHRCIKGMPQPGRIWRIEEHGEGEGSPFTACR